MHESGHTIPDTNCKHKYFKILLIYILFFVDPEVDDGGTGEVGKSQLLNTFMYRDSTQGPRIDYTDKVN